MIEIIEKKSRFLAFAHKVESVKQANDIVLNYKQMHKKATHVCFGYNINTNGVFIKCSDDGEPSGTAGKPILNVIEKKHLNNVLVCVVRYFGGVKLGAGGLIRTYTKCASLALEE